MNIELKTVMGQMNIVRGRWASQAANALAVREPTSRLPEGIRKGDLFIISEVRGNLEEAEREELSRALNETIRNVYYQSSGSITASLRRALLAGNERLLGEYAKSHGDGQDDGGSLPAPNGNLVAGVTAAAVQGEDAFIASVGPAVAYTVTRGVATQFPRTSPWLNMADPAATGASAMGRPGQAGQGWRGLDVQLFHVHLEPGDVLVLGDSRFAAKTSLDQLESGVAYQGVEGALANLGKLTGGHDCTALVVEIQAKPKSSSREQPAAPAPQPAQMEEVPAPAGSVSLSDAVPRVSFSGVGEKGAAALSGLGRAAQRNASRLPVGRWLKGVAKGLLALLMVIWTGLRTLVSRILPGGERDAVRRPVAGGQARRAESKPLPQRILRIVALIVPLVVLAAAGLTYWQRGVARENEFNELVQQAQASYQQALTADEATARQLLAQSESLLAQAESIKADEPALGELHTSIAEHQDKIDRVERLYWVGELRTYTDAGTQLRRVIVNGLYVYVLDMGSDHVYQHQLDEAGDALEADEADPILARRAQQVGSAVVGDMVDLVWMPAGGNRQTSDLLILESGGLLEYNPSWGLTTVPIAGTDTWALPVAVGSYFGNFYVLDPQLGQILRYTPTTEDYSNPPENYFSGDVTVDLTGAVDMAIDGFIYVLYADGNIRKFEGGVPVDFQIKEIDKPLERPTAIYAAPDEAAQHIYVADAGNSRVVQLNKDGRFMRQFKPRDEATADFDTLRSLYVDELSGKLYLLNDQAMYVANITPLE
jgi:hypothetical protein